MPVAFRKLRQEDHEFRASLAIYKASFSCIARFCLKKSKADRVLL
jgi:hypothetical protein